MHVCVQCVCVCVCALRVCACIVSLCMCMYLSACVCVRVEGSSAMWLEHQSVNQKVAWLCHFGIVVVSLSKELYFIHIAPDSSCLPSC